MQYIVPLHCGSIKLGITSSVKILVFIEKDIGKWVEVRFRAGLWNGVDILHFIWTLKELGKKIYTVGFICTTSLINLKILIL